MSSSDPATTVYRRWIFVISYRVCFSLALCFFVVFFFSVVFASAVTSKYPSNSSSSLLFQRSCRSHYPPSVYLGIIVSRPILIWLDNRLCPTGWRYSYGAGPAGRRGGTRRALPADYQPVFRQRRVGGPASVCCKSRWTGFFCVLLEHVGARMR